MLMVYIYIYIFIRSYTYGTPKSTDVVTLRSSRLGLASRACPSFAERPRAPQKLRAGEPAGWLGGSINGDTMDGLFIGKSI